LHSPISATVNAASTAVNARKIKSIAKSPCVLLRQLSTCSNAQILRAEASKFPQNCATNHIKKTSKSTLTTIADVRPWHIKKVSKLALGTSFAELATYAKLPNQATIGKGNSRRGCKSQ
jgi:hypothetical protein